MQYFLFGRDITAAINFENSDSPSARIIKYMLLACYHFHFKNRMYLNLNFEFDFFIFFYFLLMNSSYEMSKINGCWKKSFNFYNVTVS